MREVNTAAIRVVVPEIGEEEIQAVTAVLRTGFLVQGQHVEQFERLVANYVGVRHAVAVSSGTAALHLALLALHIGPGDEVIVPDFTFPASANVVELVGATPVLVDIDPATFNVAIDQIVPVITPRTKAIMPVHLFGQPADMDPVLDIAKTFGLAVVEDAACALGATYKGRQCGSLGTLGCFSFHPRKIITTGEGGMLVTNDDELTEQLRRLRNHGMVHLDGSIRFSLAGFNYRLTDFQGALGMVQMGKLEKIIARRTALAELYRQALATLPGVTLPSTLDGARHTWQSYVVLLDDRIERNRLMAKLRDDGIETTIGTYAVSAQPHYARYGVTLPGSLKAYKHGLCLPLHGHLMASDVEYVAACLKKALSSP